MLGNFYKSDEWITLRQIVIAERLTDEGLTICEHCGKPILKSYDMILHHVIPLTPENVDDANISLNPNNLQIVHLKCHNHIHNKLGNGNVYLIYGSPLSGKSTYVKDNAEYGDIIIDIDNIWQCISGQDKYIKPKKLSANVFGLHNELIRMIRMRVGSWNNAFIVGGYPLIGERERLCKTLGAKEIFIDTPKDECLRRCADRPDEWLKYVEDWWDKYAL